MKSKVVYLNVDLNFFKYKPKKLNQAIIYGSKFQYFLLRFQFSIAFIRKNENTAFD